MSCSMATPAKALPASSTYVHRPQQVQAPRPETITSDNVCFYDLRPNGGKPIHHSQLGSTRHVSTVLASLGVRASAGYVLECDAATSDGFATTASGATVTVWPVPVDPDEDDGEEDPPPSDVLDEDHESDSSANSE